MGKAWLIASGKGGVGKSTTAAALASAIAQSGHPACVVDTDIGLRDQDSILGVENSVVYDLLDVAQKGCKLKQALISPPSLDKLTLLPASQFARSKDLDGKEFARILRTLKEMHDHVIIDAPAGIEKGLRNLLSDALDETVIVCTPDDVCIRNAERVIQLLKEKAMPQPRLIVNRLRQRMIESGEMYSAAAVAGTLELSLLGEVPEDDLIYRALLHHINPMDVDCEANAAYQHIAKRMQGEEIPFPGIGKKRGWLDRLIHRPLKEVRIIDR